MPAERGNPATRRLILDAAERVLDEKGIADVTIDDIIRAASLARGTFYIYFDDKFDILKALVEEVTQRIFVLAHPTDDQHASAFHRLRRSIQSIIQSWHDHTGVLRALYQLALIRADFGELQSKLRAPSTHRIRLELDQSIARGHARPVDTWLAADSLATMVSWSCMLWFGLGQSPHGEVEIPHAAEQLALLWYRAVFATDPSEPGSTIPIYPDGHSSSDT